MRKEKLQKFPSECMPEFISGAVLTLGFYLIFWRRNHVKVINEIHPENQISEKWYPTCLWLKLFFVGLILLKIFIKDPIVRTALQHVGNVGWLLETIWNFKIRNKMNLIIGGQWKTSSWYSAGWTLVFGALYLQYKLNELKRAEGLPVEPVRPRDVTRTVE